MSSSNLSVTKLLTLLKQLRKGDKVGLALAAIGIVVLAIGLFLQGVSVGVGTPIRTIGGLLLLAGIAAFVFGTPHRRALAIATFKGVVARYMSTTANWQWPDRTGLAGVIIGLIWLVPVLGLMVVFGAGAGILMWPGIVIFWGGTALLIYGRYRAFKESKKASDSQGSLRGSTRGGSTRGGSTKEGRSKRRLW